MHFRYTVVPHVNSGAVCQKNFGSRAGSTPLGDSGTITLVIALFKALERAEHESSSSTDVNCLQKQFHGGYSFFLVSFRTTDSKLY